MKNRAETKEQKLEIMKRLTDAWLTHPELRLGQLIINSVYEHDSAYHLFYIKDYDLIERIEGEIK